MSHAPGGDAARVNVRDLADRYTTTVFLIPMPAAAGAACATSIEEMNESCYDLSSGLCDRRNVSRATHLRARVAALSRAGADWTVLRAARHELAAANVRSAVDRQRAGLGLPPVADDLAVVLAAAAFPEAAYSALPGRAVCG